MDNKLKAYLPMIRERADILLEIKGSPRLSRLFSGWDAERQEEFRYKDIKNVYTIVLFEKSPKEFKRFPNVYRHFFQQTSDTGLGLELLQKYVFVPLDIFRRNRKDKAVADKLDAWLLFFSSDDLEDIVGLITAYPEFKPLYEKAYDICRNMENKIVLITQIRNLASEGFSVEKCANMLAADIGTVSKAYKAIKAYSESNDAEILELLEP